MNIIDGINIVGFIQFTNMGVSRFILWNLSILLLRLIWTKFGSVMRNSTPITMMVEVATGRKFQYE